MLMATESARVMMILMIVLMIVLVMPMKTGGHDAIKHKHVGSHPPSIQQVKHVFHSRAPQASKSMLCMRTTTTKTLI